ncbi:hypothetical protein B0H66DRAFT_607464 [Apodospora peruviana]|uniref:Uncharacterized protein n=1 Tax=Apodospora peruviana TaxID=516989 RepID=A0AAE0M067_9PEZI|nr:hypothetical protein B0H66DRAFT_607464 [Apodospora peruviana]
MTASAARRDLWPSRADAEASFHRTPFYRAWDPRVLDASVCYGLCDCPTALYPDTPKGSVTLASTKHQEVFTCMRLRAQRLDPDTGRLVFDPERLCDIEQDELVEVPDYPFYQPESARTFNRLPELRPGVLWVFGGTSYVSTEPMRRQKMEATGVSLGGSGGAKAGRVAQYVLKGRLPPRRHGAATSLRRAGRRLDRARDGPLAQGRGGAAGLVAETRPAKWTMDDQLKEMIGPLNRPKL